MSDNEITLFVTDIFGKTDALLELAESITDSFDVIDPYNGKDFAFKTESEAYEYFNKNVGLEAYAETVRAQLLKLDQPTRVIAFSVGATAMWTLSEDFTAETITNADCFYGSRIRNSVDISPCFPINLVFPSREPSFSISELIREISQTPNIQITRSPYLHGFMNRYSDNFNEIAYDDFIERLKT